MGSIDIEIGDGGEGAAVRVGAAEGEEMAAVGLGADGEGGALSGGGGGV